MNNSTISDLDLRFSIWERFTDTMRVKTCQTAGGTYLSRILSEIWSGSNIQSLGSVKLYHTDSYKHLLDAINKNKLWLPRPTSWEDPWEDPVGRFFDKHPEHAGTVGKRLQFDCFALCYSTTPSCEALWSRIKNRIKDEGPFIRIETTVRDLLSATYIPSKYDAGNIQSQVFLNPVSYLPANPEFFQNEILYVLSGKHEPIDLDLVRIASLYVKRNDFDYEKEVRLVFRPELDNRPFPDTHFELDLHPETMIHSIEVDPWCDEREYTEIEDNLQTMGYPCTQSGLFNPLI